MQVGLPEKPETVKSTGAPAVLAVAVTDGCSGRRRALTAVQRADERHMAVLLLSHAGLTCRG